MSKSPPGYTRKFKVNKSQSQNYKNYNDNRQQKKDNVFLLTYDNYYFILEKKYVRNSHFFDNLFAVDDSAGHLRNPIFLQKIKSTYFKYIIQYLKKYHNCRDEKYDMEKFISINDLYVTYKNEWDVIFIKEIHHRFKDDLESFEEFLKATHYIGVFNLYNKLKYCYDFIVNTKKYKLDDLDDLDDLEEELDLLEIEC